MDPQQQTLEPGVPHFIGLVGGFQAFDQRRAENTLHGALPLGKCNGLSVP